MGMELVQMYDIDWMMIGRGVFTNPFVFEKEPKEHSVKEFLQLLLLQLDYEREIESHPFKPLLHFLKIYIHGFKGASELRHRLMSTKSTAEVREILMSYVEAHLDE